MDVISCYRFSFSLIYLLPQTKHPSPPPPTTSPHTILFHSNALLRQLSLYYPTTQHSTIFHPSITKQQEKHAFCIFSLKAADIQEVQEGKIDSSLLIISALLTRCFFLFCHFSPL